ncbi:RNase A-like domain-containing protein [Pseudomonas huanghezhanensis]|uniref:RNase A-like domain-containing protein n=1 Tax=Pseudomonas huanghezhanensis TaxID=3002903 RepID=UPI00228692B9|nr:RNase A-like domain-containing protein [Pseudomonas sp. BSw22131]
MGSKPNIESKSPQNYDVSQTQFIRKNNRLVLNFDAKRDIGWGIFRSAPNVPVTMTKVRVIIEFAEFNHMPKYILTAFPIP